MNAKQLSIVLKSMMILLPIIGLGITKLSSHQPIYTVRSASLKADQYPAAFLPLVQFANRSQEKVEDLQEHAANQQLAADFLTDPQWLCIGLFLGLVSLAIDYRTASKQLIHAQA